MSLNFMSLCLMSLSIHVPLFDVPNVPQIDVFIHLKYKNEVITSVILVMFCMNFLQFNNCIKLYILYHIKRVK